MMVDSPIRNKFCHKVKSVHEHSLGNSKAVAHVAVDLQCWYTVKLVMNNYNYVDMPLSSVHVYTISLICYIYVPY